MQKTGCTHISTLLSYYEDGYYHGKHNPLKEYIDKQILVSSVRNPWDWYISLWAYGCSGRGALYNKLTNKNKRFNKPKKFIKHLKRTFKQKHNYNIWRKLYGHPHNADLFRKWIYYLLSDEGKNDLIEGYPQSNIKNHVGFMSYRFLSLCTDFNKWSTYAYYLNDYNAIKKFFYNYYIFDRIIYTENLEDDLTSILKEIKHNISQNELNEYSKTNSSKHLDRKYYYDEQTAKLVQKEEQLLIERFGYKF